MSFYYNLKTGVYYNQQQKRGLLQPTPTTLSLGMEKSTRFQQDSRMKNKRRESLRKALYKIIATNGQQ